MTTINGNANEVLEIIDDVHRRLGQDLHDGIEQELVGLGLISQALLNRLQNDRNSIPKEKLDSYRELAKKLVEGFTRAQEGIQAISRGLIPTNGFHEDLTQALDELAARTDHLHGISCTSRCQAKMQQLPSDVALQMYRIAQEAVCNAMKHSGARHIFILLNQRDGKTTLSVADNGCGFTSQQNNHGLGLQSMQYRANLIGAKLEITTSATGGTIVCCSLGGDHE